MPPQPPPLAPWLIDLLEKLRFLAPALKVVLWGALIAAAALIVWLVVREFIGAPRGKRRKTSAPAFLKPDETAAKALLDDAERLAAEQRYAEAAHILLSRSVEAMNARRPGTVRAALTGRDLCRAPGIPDEPRDAFTRLCGVVELSLFGGRAIDAALFARCRDDYTTFAFSKAW